MPRYRATFTVRLTGTQARTDFEARNMADAIEQVHAMHGPFCDKVPGYTVDAEVCKLYPSGSTDPASCRYLGPTNSRGSRIVAKSASGHRAILHWDDALNTDENHRAAAQALADKLGWKGKLATGALANSYVHVFVED